MKKISVRLGAALLSLSLLASPASALSVEQATELLEEHYLRELPAQAYEAADLDELFALLGDPYTYYMSQEEYEEFLSYVEDQTSIVGVGVTILFTQEGILINSVLSQGSAYAAGLQPGDLIVAVDGAPCVPAEESHRTLLAGEPGTAVTLTILRDGVTRNYTLTRRQLTVYNTNVSLQDGHIGYIDCDSFGTDTGKLFTQGIQTYDSAADIWLVDLRDNPGGYTHTSVEALGQFAGPGYYLYEVSRSGSVYYTVNYQPASTGHPVVVLLNGNSASAAEIFSAGIRDGGLGITVGGRTFGKGVSQIMLNEDTHSDLFDGDALKITSYRFYSTLGNTTDLIGVIPDLMVPDQYAADIARALCGSPCDAGEGRMLVQLCQNFFYIDLAQLDEAALSALLSALPPSSEVWLGREGGVWEESSPALAAQSLGVSLQSRRFTDVADSPYADELNTMATYAMLRGGGGGRYSPREQLTRAQLCAMLSQLLHISYTGPALFSDVPDGTWYADDVNAMASLGLVEGAGGRFYPDDPLTQEQFITVAGRLARYLNCDLNLYPVFLEENPAQDLTRLDQFSSWARESASILAWSAQDVLGRNGHMLFADLEELSPKAPILREEAGACLCRILRMTGILST